MFGIQAPTEVTLFFLRSSKAARTANLQNGGPVSPRGDSWTNPCPVQETFKMFMHTLSRKSIMVIVRKNENSSN